jgi:hypothetical protein
MVERMDAAALVTPAARLALSRAPTAEIAATAIQAALDAGLAEPGKVEYVIVAVPAGRGAAIAERLEQLARAEP